MANVTLLTKFAQEGDLYFADKLQLATLCDELRGKILDMPVELSYSCKSICMILKAYGPE